MANEVDKKTKQDLAHIAVIQDIRGNLNQIRIDLAQFTVVNRKRGAEVLARRAKIIKKIKSSLEFIKDSVFDEKEKKYLRTFQTNWDEYIRQAPIFFNMAQHGKANEANKFRALYTNPPAQTASDSLDKLINYETAEVQEAQIQAVDEAQYNEKKAMIIEAFAVIAAFAALVGLMRTFYRYDVQINNYSETLVLKNEELMREQSKSLQNAKMASLGELSAGIAHEINNPLATISGSLYLLSHFRSDPVKFESKIEAINKSVKRIEKIVNGLRKFSRTSNEQIRKFEDINNIIEEALILVEVKSKHSEVEIQKNLNSVSKIFCDAIEIEQVVVNLFGNAIDAALLHDEKWVKIVTLDEAQHVVLQVIDSGQGIESELEYKLFEPFYTTKAVGKGTGLGLSISKGILEDHGAAITVNRSHPHTCFEVRFPKSETKKS